MTLEKLGRIIDRLIAKLRRQGRGKIADRLLDMVRKGEYQTLREWATRAHLDAQLTAWSLHSSWLDIPTLPPLSVQGLIAERAIAFSDDIVSRVSAVYGASEPPVAPRLYVDLLADVAARRGWSEGAQEASRQGGGKWKVWVRIYPAREPRDWHDALNGKTIPENKKFQLPGGPNAGARVSAPHDWKSLPSPEEWLNCGHAVIYTAQATWRDVTRKNST